MARQTNRHTSKWLQPGDIVTNIVLCFDRTQDHPELRDATNAEALFHLLADTDGQLTWYHPGTPATPQSRGGPGAALHWRETFFEDARATVVEAYEFIAESWQPGDRIFMFGIGRGAYCARAVTRLLGTVGVLPDPTDDLRAYFLDTYACLLYTSPSPRDRS